MPAPVKERINKKRAAAGKGPLGAEPALKAAAHTHTAAEQQADDEARRLEACRRAEEQIAEFMRDMEGPSVAAHSLSLGVATMA